jgi:GAF domain-containing protein
MPLHPLSETREALQRIGQGSDRDLTAELVRQGELVEDVVANLVGMSLALVRDGLTFTIAATREHVALLDAMQRVFGGSFVDAAPQDSTVANDDGDAGLFDEQRWADVARADAAHGVLSTLFLPVHVHGRVVGGVNLYAATPNAFAGREQQVADVLGAWAQGAVHNADLSFSTRAAARRALEVLDDLTVLAQATGAVMAARRVDEVGAREVIADAGRTAGLDDAAVARELIRPFLLDP